VRQETEDAKVVVHAGDNHALRGKRGLVHRLWASAGACEEAAAMDVNHHRQPVRLPARRNPDVQGQAVLAHQRQIGEGPAHFAWAQGGPYSAAARTPVQGRAGCGALQRSAPMGGDAYGMPRYAMMPSRLAIPETRPEVVSTTVSGNGICALGRPRTATVNVTTTPAALKFIRVLPYFDIFSLVCDRCLYHNDLRNAIKAAFSSAESARKACRASARGATL
jgi:hypothetical protein